MRTHCIVYDFIYKYNIFALTTVPWIQEGWRENGHHEWVVSSCLRRSGLTSRFQSKSSIGHTKRSAGMRSGVCSPSSRRFGFRRPLSSLSQSRRQSSCFQPLWSLCWQFFYSSLPLFHLFSFAFPYQSVESGGVGDHPSSWSLSTFTHGSSNSRLILHISLQPLNPLTLLRLYLFAVTAVVPSFVNFFYLALLPSNQKPRVSWLLSARIVELSWKSWRCSGKPRIRHDVTRSGRFYLVLFWTIASGRLSYI